MTLSSSTSASSNTPAVPGGQVYWRKFSVGQGDLRARQGWSSFSSSSSPRVMDGAGPRKPQPGTMDWLLLLAGRTKSPCTHHSFPGSLLLSVHLPSHSYAPPSSKGNERASSFGRNCFFLLSLPWRLLPFTCPVSHGAEGGGPKVPSRKGLWGIIASILTPEEAMESKVRNSGFRVRSPGFKLQPHSLFHLG